VLREPNRAPLEEYDIRPVEIVPVKASDGTLLYARLIRPAGLAFGLLAWKTRSIIPGLALHASIGLGTDLFIVLKGAGYI